MKKVKVIYRKKWTALEYSGSKTVTNGNVTQKITERIKVQEILPINEE
jgi:hypothetical protein